jgi:DNA end-binding protein Ku
MARSLWSGAITFGLISIPVKLYSSVQEKSLKFHLLHGEDGGRIKYKRVCEICNKEVGWDDIVKGYEYSKEHYVTFEGDELEALDVDSIRAIDVVSFVDLEEIDPIYFNKTYYVIPDASGLKAYKLLAQALEAEREVGIAKVALRDKEHLATIRLKDGVFVLETMYWPDEIREPEFAELKMARQLIQQLTAEFDPEEFHDQYREKLEELVQKKVEGQEITIAPEAEPEPTKVVDLMEALKASVAEAKKQKKPSSEPGPRKKTATGKASAS